MPWLPSSGIWARLRHWCSPAWALVSRWLGSTHPCTRHATETRARVPAWPSEINHRVAATSIMLLLPITSLLMPLFSHVDAVYVSFILFHIAPAGETMSISPVVPFPPLVLPPHARYLTQHTFTLFSRSFSMHSSHSYHLPPPIAATVLAFLPYPLVPPPSSHPLCPFS